MPIKPIDLQTLFTQMDRVGRERAAEKEVAASQKSIQESVIQKKAEEKAHSVQKTDETKDEADQSVAIRDDETARRGKEQNAAGEKKPEDEESSEPLKTEEEVIRDKRLGGNIDILG
jgi:hypothetical protein